MLSGIRCVRLAGLLGWLFHTVAFALPPDNDAFPTPTEVGGLPATVFGTNVGATLEVGEPVPLDSAQASVWFQWAAPISGSVSIDTVGSDFDTILAVWTGDEIDALTLVAENDDVWGLQSEVALNAVSGVVYRVAVYGYGKYRGNIALNIGRGISGTVTGPDGITPLAGMDVKSYRWSGASWDFADQAATDADGHYIIAGLPAGTYRAEFHDASGTYICEGYANSRNRNDGTDIMVSVATNVSGIDAALAVASRLNGRVTGADGTTPLAGMRVSAIRNYYGEWQWGLDGEWQSLTDTNGDYSVGGLPSGTYMVMFQDDTGGYEYELYDDADLFAQSRKVVVPAETTVSNINASLGPASTIAGTVTGADGATPLEGISVQALRFNGSWWETLTGTMTDVNGGYTIRGLRPGPYHVRFSDPSGTSAFEVYDDSASITNGTNIVVAAAENVSGIDASLGSASSIAGTVTGPNGLMPLGGIEVRADRWGGVRWEEEASAVVSTDTNGCYRISGLAAGAYRIRFFDNLRREYVSEVYAAANLFGAGMDIDVPVAASVNGIDASLDLASRISGTVTGPDGITPLDGIEVTAYWWNGTWGEKAGSAVTDPNGQYTIAGLPSGTNRVDFQDASGMYISEGYSNVLYYHNGTDIVLTPGTTVNGINASLNAGSRITGSVTGPDGITPLAGIRVYAQRPVFLGAQVVVAQYGGDSLTDTSGNYSIGGLSAGTYVVRFWDDSGAYASEVYDDSVFFPGTGVVVRAATTVSGIDASLGVASRIEGTVTGPDGTTRLANISVTAYRLNGSNWESVGGGWTAADGSYFIGDLHPGTYRVGFRGQTGTYAFEVYDNADYPENGTDVHVPEATTVTGIDLSLGVASRIEGTVTGPDGTTPLANVVVYACRLNGSNCEYLADAQTDAVGNFAIGGLRVGTYRVGFQDQTGVYAFETYDDADYPENGTNVLVSAETTRSGIDASLGLASRIEGSVIGPDGITPLAGISVFALRWNGSQWVGVSGSETEANGHYTIGGLRAGSYRLVFLDSNGGYMLEAYENAYSVESGTDIVVPAETTVICSGVSLLETGTLVPATITALRRVDTNNVEILFVGATEQQYLLQESVSLSIPSWVDCGSPITCQPGANSVTVEKSAPAFFWRMKTLP